jgi:hypothetical protein
VAHLKAIVRFKLGKKPARPEAVALKFGAYFKSAELPAVPPVFGHPWLIQYWGMLGNDSVGDCVWAAAAHETMMLRADAGEMVPLFTNRVVLSDYSAVAGYDPSDPATDQGTDMQEAAQYRQKTGVLDASGNRHKIEIYTALKAGDLDELAQAVYLNGAVSVGVQLPDSAEDQFDHAEPWDVVSGTNIVGGHCISCIGRNSRGDFLFVSWGRLQSATQAWVRQYMDEGICYVSPERLNAKGLSPQGFDGAALLADFRTVTA